MAQRAYLGDVPGRPWAPLEYQPCAVYGTTDSLAEYISQYTDAEVCPDDETPAIRDRRGAVVVRIDDSRMVFGERQVAYLYDLYWPDTPS